MLPHIPSEMCHVDQQRALLTCRSIFHPSRTCFCQLTSSARLEVFFLWCISLHGDTLSIILPCLKFDGLYEMYVYTTQPFAVLPLPHLESQCYVHHTAKLVSPEVIALCAPDWLDSFASSVHLWANSSVSFLWLVLPVWNPTSRSLIGKINVGAQAAHANSIFPLVLVSPPPQLSFRLSFCNQRREMMWLWRVLFAFLWQTTGIELASVNGYICSSVS